jgi:hypothetical protein
MRRRVRALAIAAVLAAWGATVAEGAVLEQTRSFFGDPNAINTIPGAVPAFNTYDGSSGTLTGVELDWNIIADGSVSTNLCLTIGDCDPGVYLLSMVGFGALSPAVDSGSVNSGISFATDDSQTAPIFLALVDSLAFGDPSAFLGDGSALAGYLSIAGSYLGYPHGLAGILDVTVTLTYLTDWDEGTEEEEDNPSAVPLPPALPLFATGLGILGFIGWRRRRKT